MELVRVGIISASLKLSITPLQQLILCCEVIDGELWGKQLWWRGKMGLFFVVFFPNEVCYGTAQRERGRERDVNILWGLCWEILS